MTKVRGTWIGAGAFGACCLLAAPSASAQKADFGVEPMIQAQAANKQFCQIIVTRNGSMMQNVGSTKLSSQINPALPGLADVTTSNGSYYLSVDRPTGFSIAPSGGSDDVEFSTQFTGRGKTDFALTPGDSRVKLKNGLTNVEVHLEAKKIRGSFKAGNYRATVILRCE